jgi:hypothetical protein
VTTGEDRPVVLPFDHGISEVSSIRLACHNFCKEGFLVPVPRGFSKKRLGIADLPAIGCSVEK